MCLVAQSCPPLFVPVDRSPPGSFVHGDSPCKNIRAGGHALFQGSSQLRDWTQVSRIAGRFFTRWVTGEAHLEPNWQNEKGDVSRVGRSSFMPCPISPIWGKTRQVKYRHFAQRGKTKATDLRQHYYKLSTDIVSTSSNLTRRSLCDIIL